MSVLVAAAALLQKKSHAIESVVDADHSAKKNDAWPRSNATRKKDMDAEQQMPNVLSAAPAAQKDARYVSLTAMQTMPSAYKHARGMLHAFVNAITQNDRAEKNAREFGAKKQSSVLEDADDLLPNQLYQSLFQSLFQIQGLLMSRSSLKRIE